MRNIFPKTGALRPTLICAVVAVALATMAVPDYAKGHDRFARDSSYDDWDAAEDGFESIKANRKGGRDGEALKSASACEEVVAADRDEEENYEFATVGRPRLERAINGYSPVDAVARKKGDADVARQLERQFPNARRKHRGFDDAMQARAEACGRCDRPHD
ncbi:hypothetical protein PTE30175_01969 [Pandoraea terrae]|uniref:Uncharacterized protein n=2 Tax=Pandoraea terrae TaxID=1537710 RepID=A0A5E4UIG0_9BURK|nr:hypothetical protein PTE30175_01969 [Pandoraea terrae]